MEVEHGVKVFQLDQTLQGNIEQMAADGWMLIPGVIPVGVYNVVRIKGMTAQDGGTKPIAKVAIDDTKVKILRNGELIEGT